MINREDMLELSRRMTPARASVARIAGAYFDEEGYVDGTFNTHFLKLSAAERKPGSIWQLLDGILESELKNDAFLDILYEVIGEKYQPGYSYACFLYFGQYDVPVKGSDKEWLEGSEEVYTYLLCTLSPLEGEYEPGKPTAGFLYPAFKERSGNCEYMNVLRLG